MKMKLQIVGAKGNVIGCVEFSTEHVTFAMRNAGHLGHIDESVIAEYIAHLIQSAGASWDSMMTDWKRNVIASKIADGKPLHDAQAEAIAEIERMLSWDDLNPEPKNDDGAK